MTTSLPNPNDYHCQVDQKTCQGEAYCCCQCNMCKRANEVAAAWYAAHKTNDPERRGGPAPFAAVLALIARARKIGRCDHGLRRGQDDKVTSTCVTAVLVIARLPDGTQGDPSKLATAVPQWICNDCGALVVRTNEKAGGFVIPASLVGYSGTQPENRPPSFTQLADAAYAELPAHAQTAR